MVVQTFIVQYWHTEHLQAILMKRVEFIPMDFLADQPVPGCDFYYVSGRVSIL
jgi:hypothetical protein